MILYKNTKVTVHWPDGDTDLFNIATGVLHRGHINLIPVYYQPRLCASNVGRFNERKNGFMLAKARSRRRPVRMITDADYADDIVLLANIPTQAESLLQSLEQAAGGISLHVNADKTEFMCFNQTGDISTLNGRSLKLVDKFTYLGSSVSSTENDINARLAKAWTAIHRLLVILKLDLSDKIKHSFFPSSSRVNTDVLMHHMDAD